MALYLKPHPSGTCSLYSSLVRPTASLSKLERPLILVLAGLFSSLVSHVAYARWVYPRLIARLKATTHSASALRSGASATSAGAAAASEAAVTTTKAASEGMHSLGSSGAVYAMFAITALGFPDAEITLIIPPWFPINIQTGFAALLAVDMLGVLRGWK